MSNSKDGIQCIECKDEIYPDRVHTPRWCRCTACWAEVDSDSRLIFWYKGRSAPRLISKIDLDEEEPLNISWLSQIP